MSYWTSLRRLSFLLTTLGLLGLLVSCAPASPPANKPAPTAAEQKPAAAVAPTAPPATAPPAAASAPTAQAAAPAAQAAAPTAQPAAAASGAKQELIIGQGTDPQNLDPHVVNQQPTRNITQAVNDPLVDWDFSKNALVGVLATEWKLVDPTTWQFTLRPNVKFSNGEPWNAEVAKYNFDRIRDPEVKSGYLLFLTDVDHVDIVDPMTIKFVTKAPSPSLPINLAKLGMVPKQYATEKGTAAMAKAPIGTGPYRVTEYVVDERVVLEPNADYWGPKPTLTKVTFRPIPEPASRVAALKTGRVDAISLVPIADIASIKADPNFEVRAQPGLRAIFLLINTLTFDTPLKDQKVRQALNYAIDKDALINTVLQGYGAKLNGSIVTPGYFGHDPQLQPYPYDPDKAKQLLTEAGYPNGFETSITTPQGRYIADKELAEAAAGQLAKIGVQAKVVVKDWGVITNEVGDHTLGPLAFYGLSTIPDGATQLGFEATGVRNSQRSVPAFDAVLNQARQTMDDAQRAELLHKAAAILRDDANVIFLDQQFDLYAYNKKVQNFSPLPDERIDPSTISIK
jgi:peptide/nickel transport system substrate-binding protein